MPPSHAVGPEAGRQPAPIRQGLSVQFNKALGRLLIRPRNARILGELIDVAVRRAEVHPGITALVLLSEQEDFNPIGPKLGGGRLDIVDKEACDRTRCEVAINVAVGSKDLNLATVRQLQHTESRKIQFRSKAQDFSKKVNRRLEVVRTSTYPGQLDDFHTRTGTRTGSACQLRASTVTGARQLPTDHDPRVQVAQIRDEGLYRSRELGALLAASTPPAYWCC
jgi:hypothetical protein